MRIITLNVNGIRSATRYGFLNWLAHQKADVICLQEIKALPEQIHAVGCQPEGWHCFYHSAEKKGYSGVALYSKVKPSTVLPGMGIDWIDCEGRYLRSDYEKFSVISLYMPSGTSGEHRQTVKYQFMDVFIGHLRQLKNSGREYIICGDWNIAHRPIDLKNWRANQKNSGFLPEERAWLDQVFEQEGFIDAFRVLNQEMDQYTWWSNRSSAYGKNVGWRIDYQIVTPGLKSAIKNATIFKEQKFSDHAPLIIDYDL